MGSSIEIGSTLSESDRTRRKKAAPYASCKKHTIVKSWSKLGPSIRLAQYRSANTRKENGNTKAMARLQAANGGDFSAAHVRNVPGRQFVALIAPAMASASRKS